MYVSCSTLGLSLSLLSYGSRDMIYFIILHYDTEHGARRHPPSLKPPNAILELSDAKFARIFGVISTGGGT